MHDLINLEPILLPDYLTKLSEAFNSSPLLGLLKGVFHS